MTRLAATDAVRRLGRGTKGVNNDSTTCRPLRAGGVEQPPGGRALSRPLSSPGALDPLLDRVGEARCVLLGEASHGTHESYTWRAEIEAFGNYVPTVLPHRYDAFLSIDRTEALRPLHLPQDQEREAPESYPSGV